MSGQRYHAPAEAAAQRAARERFSRPPQGVEIESARAALAPVRQLHDRYAEYARLHPGVRADAIRILLDDLAPLIYTSEELRR